MNKGALFSPSKKDPEKLNVWSALIPVIFDITCGLLLLFLGKLALKITSYTLSGVMIVFGIWSSVSYFLSSPMEKITGSLLASGLALLFSGVLLAFNPDYLKDLLPFIWGLALLYGAFLKTQYAFDEKALNIERWWILLIFAGVSLVLGIISLLDPSFLGDKRETVIGILLIAEAMIFESRNPWLKKVRFFGKKEVSHE